MTTTIPVPRFSVGQRVFYATTTQVKRQHPCPDCLGSQRWAAVSPAGTTIEIACPRCNEATYSTYRFTQLPSLWYAVHIGRVSPLTVGSVQIDTAAHDGKSVRYMAVETGVGGGSVYPEDLFFATEAEAQAEADRLAVERNERDAAAAPERLANETRLRQFTMRDAMIEQAKRDVTAAQVALDMCREDLADAQGAAR
jgi:hypothetical protein